MDCKRIEEIILTDYIDGRLAEIEVKKLKAHLEACPRCRAIADEAASTSGILRKIKPEEAPYGVWEKVRAEIAKSSDMAPAAGWSFDRARVIFRRFRPAIALAAAIVILFFMVTAVRLVPSNNTSSFGITYDDITALQVVDDNGNGAGYDFGTAAEEYFL